MSNPYYYVLRESTEQKNNDHQDNYNYENNSPANNHQSIEGSEEYVCSDISDSSDVKNHNREISQSPNFDSNFPDWNGDFQRLFLDTSLSFSERDEKLIQLKSKFFTETVRQIQELVLMTDQERRKVSLDKGIAGGQKFIFRNIFYKFARDDKKMYKGDKNAQKVAGNEFRMVKALVTEGFYNFQMRLPLVNLVDYQGHRVFASSVLPINKETIVYGTPDGGKTFYDDPQVFPLLSNISKLYNLQSYVFRGHTILGCCDLEIHKIFHKKKSNTSSDTTDLTFYFYLLDTARLCPPNEEKEWLWKLFRPEFLKRTQYISEKLCADSFSGFARRDPNYAEYNERIRKASIILKTECVYDCVKYLAQNPTEWDSNPKFVSVVHSFGINLRYLSFFFCELKTFPESFREKMTEKIFVEIFARTLKSLLHEDLRNLTPSVLSADEIISLYLEWLQQYHPTEGYCLTESGQLQHQFSKISISNTNNNSESQSNNNFNNQNDNNENNNQNNNNENNNNQNNNENNNNQNNNNENNNENNNSRNPQNQMREGLPHSEKFSQRLEDELTRFFPPKFVEPVYLPEKLEALKSLISDRFQEICLIENKREMKPKSKPFPFTFQSVRISYE